MAGENLDLNSIPGDDESQAPQRTPRRFLGITFACCDVYSRIYVNRQETAYEGNCPKCARAVRLRIGPGGTDQRFFVAQ